MESSRPSSVSTIFQRNSPPFPTYQAQLVPQFAQCPDKETQVATPNMVSELGGHEVDGRGRWLDACEREGSFCSGIARAGVINAGVSRSIDAREAETFEAERKRLHIGISPNSLSGQTRSGRRISPTEKHLGLRWRREIGSIKALLRAQRDARRSYSDCCAGTYLGAPSAARPVLTAHHTVRGHYNVWF
jgi:hypothetical protein